MAVDIRLSVGDGDVTDDLQLSSLTGYDIVNGTFSAPYVPGARYRFISWTEDVEGSTGDDLWAKVADIQTKLAQAAQAQGAYGHGTRVTLSMKLADATNFVYADIVNGSIDIAPENFTGPLVENTWAPVVNVTLLCEPYLRGEAVTTTVSGTITATAGAYATPGNTGSGGLFLAGIPGDVPALARHILTDVSTGSQITQRYRISAFSLRDPASAIAQSDFTPWVDDTPAGAGSVTSDATAVGSAGSRITLSSVMRRVAGYAKPSAAYMTGLFDVWLRVKDSNAILGAPTLTEVGIDNDVNMYLRQTPFAESASADSLSPTWEEETRVGSTVLMLVGIDSRTITISTPSGWTAGPAVAHGSGACRVAIFYIQASAARSGAEPVTFSSACKCTAQLIEVAGAAAASVDVVPTGTSSASTLAIASGALAQAREMIFGIVSTVAAGANATTTGFTDVVDLYNSTAQDIKVAYARSTSTTTQNVTFNGMSGSGSAGALISLRQAQNVAPNIPLGTYEIAVVAASSGGASLSPVSNVIAVTVTQTDSVIYAEWDAGSGTTPDHWRIYYRILGGSWEYYASPATTGTWTAYIVPDDGGTVGDPPTISSSASNVRVAVALSSGTTVYNSKSVQTQVGSGAWEWLYVATVPLPPMPASDGSAPRSWVLYAEASHPLPAGTIDFDVAVFVPHPIPAADNRHYVVSEYTGLALATLRAHKIETRRDGRTFGYLAATGGDTEAGQLDVRGDSLVGPGNCWVTVIPDVAGGVSDVVNTKWTHQVVYTPRFLWMRGA